MSYITFSLSWRNKKIQVSYFTLKTTFFKIVFRPLYAREVESSTVTQVGFVFRSVRAENHLIIVTPSAFSLRSKRFRGQRKTEERDFRNFACVENGARAFFPSPPPPPSFTRSIYRPVILCSRNRLLRRLHRLRKALFSKCSPSTRKRNAGVVSKASSTLHWRHLNRQVYFYG